MSNSSWDAVETRERIRAGDVSATEVVEAAIARAEAMKHLGGVVTDAFELARRRARVAQKKDDWDGVPTFIKDLAQVRNVRTTWGSRASGEYVSRKTDRIARTFDEVGFVTLGKSATPELGLTATTEPLEKPPCRNRTHHGRRAGHRVALRASSLRVSCRSRTRAMAEDRFASRPRVVGSWD